MILSTAAGFYLMQHTGVCGAAQSLTAQLPEVPYPGGQLQQVILQAQSKTTYNLTQETQQCIVHLLT